MTDGVDMDNNSYYYLGKHNIRIYKKITNGMYWHRDFTAEVFEPGPRWDCANCGNDWEEGQPVVVNDLAFCLDCKDDICPTCGATLKVEHALVACATREEPADYEERLLCHECGYEEKL